jgi:hypothetical protein
MTHNNICCSQVLFDRKGKVKVRLARWLNYFTLLDWSRFLAYLEEQKW